MNTEVRQAYLAAARSRLANANVDLIDVMEAAIAAMRTVVADKLRLFGSADRI